MTLTATNSNSRVQLKFKIVLEKDIVPILNHIDARVIHFEQEFVKEEAEFLKDYKSHEKEANESLEKVKKIEKENYRLLEVPLTSELCKRFLKQSSDVANVKKDIHDIETINIELEHIVTTLLKEIEDLK
ncbi:hypothetical protein Tco_1332035 [Tanacetum coccineum]